MVTPEFKAPMVAEAVKYLALFCVVGTVTAENSVKNTEHDKKETRYAIKIHQTPVKNPTNAIPKIAIIAGGKAIARKPLRIFLSHLHASSFWIAQFAQSDPSFHVQMLKGFFLLMHPPLYRQALQHKRRSVKRPVLATAQ